MLTTLKTVDVGNVSAAGTKATPAELFNKLVECAIAGLRCPHNGTFGVTSQGMSQLARGGAIRVDISGHNWRTVTILRGPHHGRHTMADPEKLKVWKTVDRSGTKVCGRRVFSHARTGGHAKRPEPSKPGLLPPLASVG